MRNTILQRVQNITALPLAEITITERPRLDYQHNNLYDVKFEDKHWIAKEFVKEDEFASSPKREYNALKLLEPFDLAPLPIDYLPYPDHERPVVIYEYMPGEMWDRRKPAPDELKLLAETWLITHQATRDGLWLSRAWDESLDARVQLHHWFYNTYFEWAEVHFPDSIPHVKRVYSLYETHADIIQKLKDARPTLFFSRSDPRFANIIARPDGRIGFVDWEDSGLRSPARTLADLVIHPNQEDLLTDTEWHSFFDVYFEGYPVQSDNLQDLIHWDKLLGSLAWFGGSLRMGVNRARQNDLAGWHINGMPAHQRLNRYFVRALNWTRHSYETRLDTISEIRFFPEIKGHET